jgi:rRNA-processing protein FCF1
MEPVRIVIDSSMFFSITELKIDFFEESKKLFGNVSFYQTKAVQEELKRLAEKSVKARNMVRIAEKLKKLYNTKTLNTKSKNADESLIEAAVKGFIIATNDKQLRKKIKELNGKVLFVRQKKFLEIM